MGKNKRHKDSSNSSKDGNFSSQKYEQPGSSYLSNNNNKNNNNAGTGGVTERNYQREDNSNRVGGLIGWCYYEKHSITWVLGCALLGMLLGFGIGTGHLTGANGLHSPWRSNLAAKIRSSYWYDLFLFRGLFLFSSSEKNGDNILFQDMNINTMNRDHIITVEIGKNVHRLTISDEATKTTFSASYNDIDLGDGSLQASRQQNPFALVDSTHPRAFATLRELVIRDGGYVHPDLGFLVPAPCGADRGLGMVSDSYDRCQVNCFQDERTPNLKVIGNNINNNTQFTQREILLKIPLESQMTRALALNTLLPLIPHDVNQRAPLEDLDDSTLLAMLLAHEKGKGRKSRFYAYIVTLPSVTCNSCNLNNNNGYDRTPSLSCGYATFNRAQSLEVIMALNSDFGLDVNGWSSELKKASDYAERISGSLARDYGEYILPGGSDQSSSGGRSNTPTSSESGKDRSSLGSSTPTVGGHHGKNSGGDNKPYQSTDRSNPSLSNIHDNQKLNSVISNIQWALCVVSSRAIAGNEMYGSLRLVPVADLINHDAESGMLVELRDDKRKDNNGKTGNVNSDEEDFLGFSKEETDAGAFIVRSLRNERHKPLKLGQELLINYNLPNYSPLDWFINTGFVPAERLLAPVLLHNALPRISRKDQPTSSSQSQNGMGSFNSRQQISKGPGGSQSSTSKVFFEERPGLTVIHQPRPDL